MSAKSRGSFQIHGDFSSAEPYGNGHINDTYCAAFDQGGTCVRYILQRINQDIFKNPAALMDNIQRVDGASARKGGGRSGPPAGACSP